MDPSEIGVILVGGMRSHQENYAAAFAAAGCRLLAVGLAEGLSADEGERHRDLAVTFDLPLLSLDRAVALPGAHVASIAVGMMHRERIATACAGAGLHLYLDKPLAGSAADAAAIAGVVAGAGVLSQVFSHVTAAWAHRAREAVRDGRLGRIRALHADMLMAKGVPSEVSARPRRETAAPEDFPDDVAKREMTDMGVYPVALVTWLLERRVRTVSAATANHFFAEHLDRNVEDYGAMLLGFEDDATASITCGRVGWQSHHQPFLARVVIVGETGTQVFATDQDLLRVTTSRGMAPPPANPADPMDMWMSTRRRSRLAPAMKSVSLDPAESPDVAAFVAGLAYGGEMGIGVADAVHHCEILAAAYRSATEQQAVEVVAAQSLPDSR